MTSVAMDLLERLRLGEADTYRGLTVVPLFGELGGPDYITLGQAIESGALTVGEVHAGGSVPELQAVNDGGVGVLILDGEELSGAKQNRVLNASMFVPAKSAVTLPVSCTEQGRWSYTSDHFSDSGVVAEHNVRRRKVESVSASLRENRGFRSDQSGVWDEVQALHVRHGVASRTGAMRDVFHQYERELADVSDVIGCHDGQIGVAVALGSRVLGVDVISRPEAYSALHRKLMWSYSLDALSEESPEGGALAVQAFIDSLAAAAEERFEAPGAGTSVRLAGDAIVGQALVVDDAVVHAVAFVSDRAATRVAEERMASYAARRRRLGR